MEDFDTFLEKYRPIEKEPGNLQWETYGEDLEQVKLHAAEGNYVWTVVDGEGSSLTIIPGARLVDRLLYLICEVPFENDCQEEYEY